MLQPRYNLTITDPGKTRNIVDAVYTEQYVYGAIATLLVYDAAINIDKEIKHFWSQPWKRVSLLYFANRYIGVLGALSRLPMASISAYTSLNFYWFGSFANLITIVTVDYVLLLRVCAMHGSARHVTWILGILLSIEAAIRFGMIVYTMPHLQIFVETFESTRTTCLEQSNESAVARKVPILNWSFSMLYGIAIIGFTIIKVVKLCKSQNYKSFSLINAMVREQSVYFFILTICCVMCTVEDAIDLQNNIWNAILVAIGSTSYLSLLGCRMLIHLKEAGEKNQGHQGRVSIGSLNFEKKEICSTSSDDSVLIVEGKHEEKGTSK